MESLRSLRRSISASASPRMATFRTAWTSRASRKSKRSMMSWRLSPVTQTDPWAFAPKTLYYSLRNASRTGLVKVEFCRIAISGIGHPVAARAMHSSAGCIRKLFPVSALNLNAIGCGCVMGYTPPGCSSISRRVCSQVESPLIRLPLIPPIAYCGNNSTPKIVSRAQRTISIQDSSACKRRQSRPACAPV